MIKYPLIILVILSAAAGTFLLLKPESQNSAPDILRTFWERRIEEVGADQAYEELKKSFAASHFSDQHTAVHLFGEVLYEKSGIDGVTVCDGTFSFGCFHGHFVKAMAERGISIVKELDNACVSKYAEYAGRLSGCRHGIGHGLMEYYGDDISLALSGCEYTADKIFRFGCSSGAFMEFNIPLIFSSNSANTEPRILGASPYTPCESVDPKFAYSCYFELPQWWLIVYERSYLRMGNSCSRLDGSKREACFRGLGFYFVPDSDYNIGSSIEKCEAAAVPLDKLNCRIGEAFSFLVQSDKADLAAQLCEGLNSTDKKSCLEKSDLFESN